MYNFVFKLGTHLNIQVWWEVEGEEEAHLEGLLVVGLEGQETQCVPWAEEIMVSYETEIAHQSLSLFGWY